MANIISSDSVNEELYIQMNNGLTAVFVDVICLAGSEIAQEIYQKDFMIWFAQRDYKLWGLGIIGFDLVNILWEKEIFQAQKNFILEVLDRALKKINWNLLSYAPREDWVLDCIERFQQMIEAFDETHLDKANPYELISFEKQYEKCPKHQVFLHIEGCVICNNE